MVAVHSFDEYPHFFEVKLELFDGPIDLLLHLVKANELPVEKVSLAEVTTQYLRCLEEMGRFDLEVAGEYLVIAATLLSIKSSLLLNEPVELVEDEEGNLFDPHEELLRRLREAEVYKEGAEHLGSRGMLGVDVFSPPSSLRKVKGGPVEYKDHDPMLLGKAFHKILEGLKENEESVYAVTLESVSIVERMMDILEKLRDSEEAVAFYKLIPDITSRASIIGTFVALLELCRRQVISVRQEADTEEILIAPATDRTVLENLDALHLSSEFDVSEQVLNGNGVHHNGNGNGTGGGTE